MHVLVEVECGEHQDPRRRARGDQPARRLDAVQHRHPDVHQDHVRRPPLGQPHRLGPVLGLAGHLDVGLGLEDGPEPAPHERLVVADQDPDAHARGSSSGMRARTW